MHTKKFSHRSSAHLLSSYTQRILSQRGSRFSSIYYYFANNNGGIEAKSFVALSKAFKAKLLNNQVRVFTQA